MTKVKLLTNDFLPNWQKGIEIELEGERLKELLDSGAVEALEETESVEEVKEELEVVEDKPKKKKSK